MAEINIYGAVGETLDGEGVTAKSFAAGMKDIDPDEPLTVFVNSPGGSVFDGLSIYQTLVTRPGEIHFVLQGVAASIASIIPMAGDTITMGQSSRIMIHNPMGPSALAFGTSDDLRDAAEDTLKTAALLDSVRDTLADIYAARTKMSKPDLLAQMEAETWMTAKDALKNGFADKVTPNKAIAASLRRHPPGIFATAMESVDELLATAALCDGIRIRNRRLPSPERLRLAKAKMDLTI